MKLFALIVAAAVAQDDAYNYDDNYQVDYYGDALAAAGQKNKNKNKDKENDNGYQNNPAPPATQAPVTYPPMVGSASECFYCVGTSMEDCANNGYAQTCDAGTVNEDGVVQTSSSCMILIRKQYGATNYVEMGCKDTQACHNNKVSLPSS